MTRPSLNRSRAALFTQLAALIAIAILGIAFARVTPAAEPLRLAAQAGLCEHGQAGKGTWWNDAYPTSIDLRSSCWQLGASRIERRYDWANVGWRLAYVDLGRYSADNQFAMRDEQQFTSFDPEDCEPSMNNCFGRGKINGRTRGISFTGLAERSYARLNLGLEAGAFVYYNRFDVAILPVHPGDFSPHRHTWAGWLVTPVIGVTANYGHLFATARSYLDVKAHQSGCGGCSGITDGPAWQVTIGFQIPLR